jgi:hypothetical protein
MESLALLGLLLMFNPNAEPMRQQDIALEATYMAFHIADWGQTRDLSTRHCDSPPYNNIQNCLGGFFEGNPIIGAKPTTEEVDRYMLSTAILHAGIVKSLPSKYREKFQMLTIGIEAGFVHYNAKMGLKVNF